MILRMLLLLFCLMFKFSVIVSASAEHPTTAQRRVEANELFGRYFQHVIAVATTHRSALTQAEAEQIDVVRAVMNRWNHSGFLSQEVPLTIEQEIRRHIQPIEAILNRFPQPVFPQPVLVRPDQIDQPLLVTAQQHTLIPSGSSSPLVSYAQETDQGAENRGIADDNAVARGIKKTDNTAHGEPSIKKTATILCFTFIGVVLVGQQLYVNYKHMSKKKSELKEKSHNNSVAVVA